MMTTLTTKWGNLLGYTFMGNEYCRDCAINDDMLVMVARPVFTSDVDYTSGDLTCANCMVELL